MIGVRAFVALELPQDFEGDVAVLARQLQAQVRGRFMRRDTYHVTLAFLGEIDEAAARQVVDALDLACGGAPAVQLVPDGLGTFGRPHDATLWLGLRLTPELDALASAVRDQLDVAGVGYDQKAFRPHITLARRAALSRRPLDGLMFPAPATACRVTLFKSVLSQEGATYKALYRAALGG